MMINGGNILLLSVQRCGFCWTALWCGVSHVREPSYLPTVNLSKAPKGNGIGAAGSKNPRAY